MNYLLKSIKYFLFIVLIFAVIPYIICPYYTFPKYQRFTGNRIFNPYLNTEKYKWFRVNLHSHSNAWYGITSGNNSSDSVYRRYKYFHFDVTGISDYMKINKFLAQENFYIPVYEHGYGISKVHQLAIGARKVVWLDFLYFFNTHQKQFIINLLKNNSDLVSLNHPRYKNAYTIDDLKKLSNYDCFEALNRSWFSLHLWDSLLSVGHYVPLIANDDCHDVSNVFDIATNYTLVKAKSYGKQDIINALKTGSSAGVDIFMNDNETFISKLIKVNNLTKIKKVVTTDNDVTVATEDIVREFKFIGQNGKVKKVVNNSDSANYCFNKDDTYIRIEITTLQGSRLFLNPVFKYIEKSPKLTYQISYIKTFVYRIITILVFVIIVFIFFRKKLFVFRHRS